MPRLHSLMTTGMLSGAALAALWLASCSGDGKFVPVSGPGSMIKFTINGKTLDAEMATEHETREHGLMFRKSEDFPENRAMLFVFNDINKRSFWMRNCTLPLSIAFIGETGEILQIENMMPHDERYTVSKDKVRYAIEVNQGWFQRNGVKAGDRFDDFTKKLESLRG